MPNSPLISLIREALAIGVDPLKIGALCLQYAGTYEIDKIDPGEHHAMYLRTQILDEMREVQRRSQPPKEQPSAPVAAEPPSELERHCAAHLAALDK